MKEESGETLNERFKSYDEFFSSCIDLVPAKIYLNPDDRLNWIKSKVNEIVKKKKQVVSKEENKSMANGFSSKSTNGSGKVKANRDQDDDDDDDDNDDEESDNDDDMNDDYDNEETEREILSHIDYNKFDPRFFKSVSQILQDLCVLNDEQKKKLKFPPNFGQYKAKSVKSTETKVFNKSQNKSSKAASKSSGNEKDSSASSGNKMDKQAESNANSKTLKRSKAKQERQAQMKRQRFDSQSEPQIVTTEQHAMVDSSASTGSNSPNRQPILNKNGQIVYSKFDFTADKTIDMKKNKIDKALPSNAKPKDYKKLLKKLQEKREKVDALKISEPEKAKEIEMKEKWKTALDKAAGVKVKDDVALLKKSLKKVEKKKEHSKKKWEERTKAVEERRNIAQEKRKKNLNKRREQKKEKKMKMLKKKGRILPGF